jgi:hypothetical protein
MRFFPSLCSELALNDVKGQACLRVVQDDILLYLSP